MIDIDPAVLGGWRQGGKANGLCLEVDDPVGAWPALCEVFDEVATAPASMPTERAPHSWSEAVVTPWGVLFRCTTDAPVPTLDELATRLGERGIVSGRLTFDTRADDTHPGALLDVAERTSWIAAWLVPLMVPGLSFSYRTLREWRIRRFPSDRVARVVSAMVDQTTVDEALVGWSGGSFELSATDLPDQAARWLGHGITTTSVLGTVDTAGPVLVTSVRRGTELMGVGHAGTGLVDDLPRMSILLDQLTDLIVELSDVLAYAVIGVHETGRAPAMGLPFREAVPATARAQSRGLSLAALDQWVLDAAPVQLLSPHHQLSKRDGIVDEALPSGRRLVRIGTPEDWFSGATRRTQVRNRGREALAACLPPPKTPMPAPLL